MDLEGANLVIALISAGVTLVGVLLAGIQILLRAALKPLERAIDEQAAKTEAQSEKADALGRELRAAIETQGKELRGAIERQGARTDALGKELRGAIEAQSAKTDALGKELRGAIEAQSAKTDALGKDLRGAIEAQSAKTDALGKDLRGAIEARGAKSDAQNNALRGEIARVLEGLRDLGERVARLEALQLGLRPEDAGL